MILSASPSAIDDGLADRPTVRFLGDGVDAHVTFNRDGEPFRVVGDRPRDLDASLLEVAADCAEWRLGELLVAWECYEVDADGWAAVEARRAA